MRPLSHHRPRPVGRALPALLASLPLLVCVFIGTTFGCRGTVTPQDAAQRAGQVVATVDGSVITLQHVRRAVYRRALTRDGAGGVGAAADQQVLQATLEDLIERRLLTLAAKAHHQAVFSAEVDAAWRLFTHRWEPGALTQTLAQLRLSALAIKEDLREALLTQKYLRAMVQDRVAVLDADIERYLATHPQMMQQPEQVRLRHMVVADEVAAQGVVRSLRGGETFASLAVSRSQAADAPSGGDLGLVVREDVPASVAQMVFALPARHVSAPVALCDGVHLFYVSEKFSSRRLTLAQARPKAEAVLRREREAQATRAHIAELKQAATIVTHEVSLADIL